MVTMVYNRLEAIPYGSGSLAAHITISSHQSTPHCVALLGVLAASRINSTEGW